MALPPEGTPRELVLSSQTVIIPDTVTVADNAANDRSYDGQNFGTAEYLGTYAIDGTSEPLWDVYWTNPLTGLTFGNESVGFTDVVFGHRWVQNEPYAGWFFRYDDISMPMQFQYFWTGTWAYYSLGQGEPRGNPQHVASANKTPIYEISVTDNVVEPTYYPGDIISSVKQ